MEKQALTKYIKKHRGMHYLADKRIVGNPNFSADRSGSLLAQVEQVAPDSLSTSIKNLAAYETADEKRSKIREIINMLLRDI